MPGFTRVVDMPPARRRARGSYMQMIGAQSWDDILDGAAYEVELPDNNGELCEKFIRAARAIVWTKGVREERNFTLHIVRDGEKPNTRFTLQMLDKGGDPAGQS